MTNLLKPTWPRRNWAMRQMLATADKPGSFAKLKGWMQRAAYLLRHPRRMFR